jgi:hypothetical protein
MKDRLIQAMLAALGTAILLVCSMVGYYIVRIDNRSVAQDERLDRIEMNQKLIAEGLDIALGGD